MNSPEFNIHGLMDSGQGAIHLACKFNNKDILDTLTNKGVSITLLDSNGNTPIHIASKYGHVDMCKYLIDQGAKITVRNHERKTPYEIADSHLVRQYLLPLTFKAEAELQTMNGGAGSSDGYQSSFAPLDAFAANVQTRDTSKIAEIAPPPPMAMGSGGVYDNGVNPYAAQQGSLQHPSYAAYSNPYATATQDSQQQQYGAPVTAINPYAQTAHVPTATSIAPQPAPQFINPYAASVAAPVAAPVAAQSIQQTVPAPASTPTPVFAPISAPVIQQVAPTTAAPPAAVAIKPQTYGMGMSGMSAPVRSLVISHSPLKKVDSVNILETKEVANTAASTSAPQPAPVPAPVPAPLPAPVVTPAVAPMQSYSRPAPVTPSISVIPSANANANASGVKRRIVADGFHSSSNDPALQKLYGHQIASKNLAPPPIFGAEGMGGPTPAMAPPSAMVPPPAMAPPPAVGRPMMTSNGSSGSLTLPSTATTTTSTAPPLPHHAAPPPPVVITATPIHNEGNDEEVVSLGSTSGSVM